VANDGDAGGASDDARRVSEGVGLDPTRQPVAKPQRRRPRGHVCGINNVGAITSVLGPTVAKQ